MNILEGAPCQFSAFLPKSTRLWRIFWVVTFFCENCQILVFWADFCIIFLIFLRPRSPRFSPGSPPVLPRFSLFKSVHGTCSPPVLPRFSPGSPPVLPRFSLFKSVHGTCSPPVLPRFSPGSPRFCLGAPAFSGQRWFFRIL